MSDLLAQVQALQTTDRGAAEALLLPFLRDTFPTLGAQSVTLRPLAVSLNSFNGLLRAADGRTYFFKSHVEQDGMLDEYYRAELLAEAGYPMITPVAQSTQAGQQVVVYPYIDAPSVFDVAWALETGQADDDTLARLTAAQHTEDQALWARYQATFAQQSAEDAARAPVHQLFHHRLAGERAMRFYGTRNALLPLPGGALPLHDVFSAHWVVNGEAYNTSIDALMAEGRAVLQPGQAGASVVGHGDAHNGNVFFLDTPDGPRLAYFDPAFGGRHTPLLDLVKPLFHNVFAMWMYFPGHFADRAIAWHIRDGVLTVDHDVTLTPVRQMFWHSKVQHTLRPLVQHLAATGQLPAQWRRMVKLALMCCPLLTMNLADAQRFPPAVRLLALAQAVSMGAESRGQRSLLDATLDTLL